MEYVPGSTLFHLWAVVQIFQRESIFCSKISSGGSLFIEKLVPGGTNFGGSIFAMTWPFQIEFCADIFRPNLLSDKQDCLVAARPSLKLTTVEL